MPKFKSKVFAKVLWFDDKRGFGFLVSPDFPENFYVHYSAIINENPGEKIRRTLVELQEVVIEEYAKFRKGKLMALKVRKL